MLDAALTSLATDGWTVAVDRRIGPRLGGYALPGEHDALVIAPDGRRAAIVLLLPCLHGRVTGDSADPFWTVDDQFRMPNAIRRLALKRRFTRNVGLLSLSPALVLAHAGAELRVRGLRPNDARLADLDELADDLRALPPGRAVDPLRVARIAADCMAAPRTDRDDHAELLRQHALEVQGQISASAAGVVYEARCDGMHYAVGVHPYDRTRQGRLDGVRGLQVLAVADERERPQAWVTESGDQLVTLTRLPAGRGLAARVAKGSALPAEESIQLASSLARLLRRVHEQHVCHQSLRPENVHPGPPLVVTGWEAGRAPRLQGVTSELVDWLAADDPFTAPELLGLMPDRDGRLTDVFGWGTVVSTAVLGRLGPLDADAPRLRRALGSSPPLAELVVAARSAEPSRRPAGGFFEICAALG